MKHQTTCPRWCFCMASLLHQYFFIQFWNPSASNIDLYYLTCLVMAAARGLHACLTLLKMLRVRTAINLAGCRPGSIPGRDWFFFSLHTRFSTTVFWDTYFGHWAFLLLSLSSTIFSLFHFPYILLIFFLPNSSLANSRRTKLTNGGRQHRSMVSMLASRSSYPSFDCQHSQNFFRQEIVNVAEVHQQRCLEESEQWLESAG